MSVYDVVIEDSWVFSLRSSSPFSKDFLVGLPRRLFFAQPDSYRVAVARSK